MAKSCGSGKIRRKSYTRKDSKKRIPSACVKDMGKPGKTPKSKRVLPEPGDKLHLSRYGYSTHKSDLERQKALMKATKDEPMLSVYRRLVLLSNYQSDQAAKKTMREDVEFMKAKYAQRKGSKKKFRKSKKSKKSRKSKK